jgi:thiamine monophosphate kinase
MALRGLIDIREYPEAMEFTRRPRINLGVGLKISECNATAAIDNSDGWAATLHQLSEASKVKVVVEEIHATREAVKLLQELKLTEEELLESWEDYNIAVTISEGNLECLLDYCKKEGIECHTAGRIEAGEGVYFKDRKVGPKGWAWFS